MDRVSSGTILFAGFTIFLTTAMGAIRVFYTWLKQKQNVTFVDKLTCLCMIPCIVFPLIELGIFAYLYDNTVSCVVGRYVCVVVYITAKAIIYLLFIEKAFIANKGLYNGRRRDNFLYRINLLIFGVYLVIVIYLLVQMTISTIELVPNARCSGTLARVATAPLLVFDTIFSAYQTMLFVVPLYKSLKRVPDLGNSSSEANVRLRNLIRKCLIGSSLTLVSSFANLLAIVLVDDQRHEICACTCMVDILINCFAANYVTGMNISNVRAQEVESTSCQGNNYGYSGKDIRQKHVKQRIITKGASSSLNTKNESETGDLQPIEREKGFSHNGVSLKKATESLKQDDGISMV
mmetsp:Transcript_19849/g.32627  ORF Transcript_19849/g.32627 Transcript_19849/m.32627 type:complete len:349 (-) Transcript_19849:3281-4327(-)